MFFLLASSLTYQTLFEIRKENDMKKIEEAIENSWENYILKII